MPELVNQRPDGYYAVDYDKMIGLLIEVVKEQEKRIKDLENKITCQCLGLWSRGMMLALGARGREFDSPKSPYLVP